MQKIKPLLLSLPKREEPLTKASWKLPVKQPNKFLKGKMIEKSRSYSWS